MTTRNPLDQFRRTQPTASAQQPAPNGKKPYEAYKAQDRKPERLEIRTLLQPHHAPSYRYLMDLTYDGEQGTILKLVYSFMLVEIRGRNLQPVIYAIAEGRCDFIQDFDEREFIRPVADKPLIETIEITTGSEDK